MPLLYPESTGQMMRDFANPRFLVGAAKQIGGMVRGGIQELLGRTTEPKEGSIPIMFLSGVLSNATVMHTIRARLGKDFHVYPTPSLPCGLRLRGRPIPERARRALGHVPLFSHTGGIVETVGLIRERVDRIATETKYKLHAVNHENPMHLVGYSMGSLEAVATDMMDLEGKSPIGKSVVIAPTWYGYRMPPFLSGLTEAFTDIVPGSELLEQIREHAEEKEEEILAGIGVTTGDHIAYIANQILGDGRIGDRLHEELPGKPEHSAVTHGNKIQMDGVVSFIKRRVREAHDNSS